MAGYDAMISKMFSLKSFGLYKIVILTIVYIFFKNIKNQSDTRKNNGTNCI